MREPPLRERHAARVEPAVDYLAHTLHLCAALGARERDVIDPRLVHLQVRTQFRILSPFLMEIREGMRIALLDLADAGGRVLVLGICAARPNVERRAPIALAAERPIHVVLKEVAKATVLDVIG